MEKKTPVSTTTDPRANERQQNGETIETNETIVKGSFSRNPNIESAVMPSLFAC